MKHKRFLSICLTVALSFTLIVPASALDLADSDILEQYEQYTIDFTDQASTYSANADVDTVAAATEFVNSLDLGQKGYSYIEESCLAELNAYSEDGVVLDSYTVLVPKATASEQVFGTYLGRTYYYTLSSKTNMRFDEIEDQSTSADKGPWDDFVFGIVNFVACFGTWKLTIPYTALTTLLGLSGQKNYTLTYQSHFIHTYQVAAYTRTIYAYGTTGNKVVVRTDQSGIFDGFLTFKPVGTGFTQAFFPYTSISGQEVASTNYYDTNTLLVQCNSYFNHGGQVTAMISTALIGHKWE